jgi:DnaJ-class molecular chaperone
MVIDEMGRKNKEGRRKGDRYCSFKVMFEQRFEQNETDSQVSIVFIP